MSEFWIKHLWTNEIWTSILWIEKKSGFMSCEHVNYK